MIRAEMSKQLVITVDNRVGTLAEVTRAVSASGINLIALCAYAVDNKGVIMFVSEDNDKALKILKAKKYDLREEPVVLVTIDNKPGTLQSLTEKIAAAGIDITLIYASVAKGDSASRFVLISEDNRLVLATLKLK